MSGDHYFSPTPHGAARGREVAFSIGGREFRLLASSGVFSADRLDPGTAVLLRKAPLPPMDTPRTLLDLGCGYGAITCVLAAGRPLSTVYAVDVNTRALDLVRRNASSLAADPGGTARVIAVAPEEVPDGVRFDEIWSNPPIRIGKPELHDLLDRWLPRLTPGGVAWLVVGRYLGADSLQRWLTDRGHTTQRHASQKGYRLLKVKGQSYG